MYSSIQIERVRKRKKEASNSQTITLLALRVSKGMHNALSLSHSARAST